MSKHRADVPVDSHVHILTQFEACDKAVQHLLNIPVGDGRSPWHWFMLANGDVALGFYPQADGRDGYFGTEILREDDWSRAQAADNLSDVTVDVRDLL